MKEKWMTQDTKWPSVSFTRLGLLIGTPLAVVLSIHGVAWAAATLKTWNAGEILTADDLNANLAALNDAMVDKTTDQTIGGAKTFTGNATFGGTASVTGDATFGGAASITGPLKVGYRAFFANPGVPATGCVRTANTTVGSFDCTCPAGMVALTGGVYTGYDGTRVTESRPVDLNIWRFGCANASNTAVDCPYYSYTCARLAAD